MRLLGSMPMVISNEVLGCYQYSAAKDLLLASGFFAEMRSIFIGHTVPDGRVWWWDSLVYNIGPFFCIHGVEFEPFLQAGFGVGPDRFYGTFRHADAAVDAFVWMDDEHILALVETVHRTHLYAVHVFALYAGFDDDKGHFRAQTASDSQHPSQLRNAGRAPSLQPSGTELTSARSSLFARDGGRDPGDAMTAVETVGKVTAPDSCHIYPKFQNDRGMSEIRIGAKEFECIGQSPPQDHPHVFLEMGNQDRILCPYCNTLFRFDPSLETFESKPAESLFGSH
jgi:uncharacterized Zn-finger protein